MKPEPFPSEALRAAVVESLPAGKGLARELPEPRFVYLPRAHTRALHPDTALVQGICGAGKSLWWAALQSAAHRKLLASGLGHGVLDANMRVSTGFGAPPNSDSHPDKENLTLLLAAHEPRRIWRTIVLHLLTDKDVALGHTWGDRVRWVEAHPEEVDERLSRIDERLSSETHKHLIVFDALDQTAETRTDLRRMLKGLLEILLELRGFRAIRAKAFVRPDMLAPEVMSFPGASKIATSDVQLSWPRADLFALLWQHLANAQHGGEDFRRACESRFGQSFQRLDETWVMPDALRRDEDLQRDVFHAIAGPYMGEGPRRGSPYRWLPNRLADALGQVSPRSFLAAVRAATEDEAHRGNYPLHHEAIKTGVQAASRTRVEEMGDEHRWIRAVMKPLLGLSVPCQFAEIVERWDAGGTLAALATGPEPTRPSRSQEGYPGVCKDLADLAIFERMSDGRINVPDVYRVGFGVRRRGGVKPVG